MCGIVLKRTATLQYIAAGTNLKRLVSNKRFFIVSKHDTYFLLMQTMTNVVIQEFVQRTLTVSTPTAATTANAGMDIQRMTMVRARVSKLFQFYDLCLLFLPLQIIE